MATKKKCYQTLYKAKCKEFNEVKAISSMNYTNFIKYKAKSENFRNMLTSRDKKINEFLEVISNDVKKATEVKKLIDEKNTLISDLHYKNQNKIPYKYFVITVLILTFVFVVTLISLI